MKRLAIFVEGYTELLFVEKLVREVATASDVIVETAQIRGGGASGTKRVMKTLTAAARDVDARYAVLIVDCGGEDLVATRLREEHAGLTEKGYVALVGLRDVFPNYEREDIPKLEKWMYFKISTKLAPVSFVLATMEVEAWFMAEHTHFERLHRDLTPAVIEMRLGFDPAQQDMSLRDNPARDLADAYALVGLDHRKPWTETVDALDMSTMYMDTRGRLPALDRLVDILDGFFTPIEDAEAV